MPVHAPRSTSTSSLLALLSVMFFITGCLHRIAPEHTADSTKSSAVVSYNGVELPQNNKIDLFVFTNKTFKLTVGNADNSSVSQNPIATTVEVSTDRKGFSWETIDRQRWYAPYGNEDAIDAGNFSDKLTDVRYLRITVKGKDDQTAHTYFAKYRDHVSFSAASPVLYRIDGSAGGFGTDAFAPSVGALMKLHTQSENFPYWGLLPLLSVYRSEQSVDATRPYSLVLGGAIDFGGWFQLGGSYHFKTKKPALIIGARPEAIASLFGNAKP